LVWGLVRVEKYGPFGIKIYSFAHELFDCFVGVALVLDKLQNVVFTPGHNVQAPE
jgi:hypothetical protein